MAEERWLQVEDIARQLQVHVETVRRWLRTGELRGVHLGGKSGYRIMEADLREFLERRYNRPRRE